MGRELLEAAAPDDGPLFEVDDEDDDDMLLVVEEEEVLVVVVLCRLKRCERAQNNALKARKQAALRDGEAFSNPLKI
jgi:hypothetical protein